MNSSACNIFSYKIYSDSNYQTISTAVSFSETDYNPLRPWLRFNINIANGPTSFWWIAVFSDGSEKQMEFEGNKEFVADDCGNYITLPF
jgi:hypothetical protein